VPLPGTELNIQEFETREPSYKEMVKNANSYVIYMIFLYIVLHTSCMDTHYFNYNTDEKFFSDDRLAEDEQQGKMQ
jgi:hypothetical protein